MSIKSNTWLYAYKKDIVSLLSCENEQGKFRYIPKIIELPQCLVDLDILNGHELHKINFYLNIDAIIYDIYNDIRLKSLRNAGLMFYPIEKNYLGIIVVEIKLKSKQFYLIPETNKIYYDITHIRFERLVPRYVPFFVKKFIFKYKLFNVRTNSSNTINKISSGLCYFQIKFFPWDCPYNKNSQYSQNSTDETSLDPYNYTDPA